MFIAMLTVPVTIGIAALAVEGGLWYADHHQMRNMADAAALAAGWARREGTNEMNASLTAVPAVGYNAATDEIELISPPDSGAYAGDPLAIDVIARRTRTVTLSSLFFGGTGVDIEAHAIVRMQSLGAYCVLALDPTASSALSLVGTTNLNLVNCGVMVDSNAANALTMVGNSKMKLAWTEVTGGISLSGGATITSTEAPETGVIPRPDPYANLPQPPSGSCTVNGFNPPSNKTTNITPGRYCGGFTLNGKATVNMAPGTYYINGSSMSINGNSTLTGSGVTIVLTGSGSDYATVTINGGAKVTLTAPSSGTYKGLVLAQDRNAPSTGTNKFNGGSTMSINGALYLPKQTVEFAGGNSTGMGCTRLIARIVDFTGNATLGDNCGTLGLPEDFADNPQLVG